ncbi:hypothetical protein Pve01_84380 [Planomonospora venezuelensis]|nr:hypothetical protein Pve01_84380 [Planomonospora venezuelensis]
MPRSTGPLQPYAVLLMARGPVGAPGGVGPLDERRKGRMERQQEVVAGDRGAATAPDVEQSGSRVSPGDPIARAAVPAKGEE